MSGKERIELEGNVAVPFNEERRGAQRMRLQVPLFIRGNDANGQQFMELAKALDISSLGALITCPRALTLNGVATLTIPTPPISATALVPHRGASHTSPSQTPAPGRRRPHGRR